MEDLGGHNKDSEFGITYDGKALEDFEQGGTWSDIFLNDSSTEKKLKGQERNGKPNLKCQRKHPISQLPVMRLHQSYQGWKEREPGFQSGGQSPGFTKSHTMQNSPKWKRKSEPEPSSK